MAASIQARLLAAAATLVASAGCVSGSGYHETTSVAVAGTSSNSTSDGGDGDEGSDYGYYRVCDPALAAISAWLVLVITLEVNDFRHHVHLAHGGPDGEEKIPPRRYVASLVAIRLGLRDALVDAALLYSLLYAIVAGFTYADADPNSLFIIWGFSSMVSAFLLAVAALKIPHWLGFYRKNSSFQLLKDTSTRAPEAVQELTDDGGSVTAFRYHVRLGVGRHAAQFVFFLLPFYVGLQVWQYFLSVFIGYVVGHFFLYVVFKCRQRFTKHLGKVAIGSSVAVSCISAYVFSDGMFIIDSVWKWDFVKTDWALSLLSWLSWLALCLFLQGIQFCEHRRFSKESAHGQEAQDDEPMLFIEDDSRETVLIDSGLGKTEEQVAPDDQEGFDVGDAGGLQEPLMGTDRRDLFKKESLDASDQSYFYQTGYFDRVTLMGIRSKKEPNKVLQAKMESEDITELDDVTPNQIYRSFATVEESNQGIKWYNRVWNFLPFKALANILMQSCGHTWSCCRKDSNFKEQSCSLKTWHMIIKFLKIIINLLAIYVSVVAMGATYQIKRTKRKLPAVRHILYAGQNEGPVCAFDEKCGDLRDFDSKEEADLANYSVAHCGPCGHCSTWNDLELQYSTRTFLAEKAQKCGMKTMGKPGVEPLQKCLEEDIGWTSNCARCWAEDIFCTKKFCIFIYLQSRMTAQLGNFAVGPDTITSATCEEANCEAGNPGHFVQCSGSNRRRMNITSEIPRPEEEQCQIVAVSDWGEFFDPKC